MKHQLHNITLKIIGNKLRWPLITVKSKKAKDKFMPEL
jgi:hypothetical protein